MNRQPAVRQADVLVAVRGRLVHMRFATGQGSETGSAARIEPTLAGKAGTQVCNAAAGAAESP